jgi:hypothetical protein
MPTAVQKRLPNADVWEPLHIQLVIFPNISPVDLNEDWFRDITGKKATESKVEPHLRIYAGDLDDFGILNITIDQLRIVLTVGPKVDVETMPALFPTLGPINTTIPSFVRVGAKLLKAGCSQMKVMRLGFICRIVQPVKDHNSGYKTLRQYLPTVNLDPKSTDFMYRINRRRKSVTGPRQLLLNRLSTWSIITRAVQAQTVLSTGQASEKKSVVPPSLACMAELDINTDPGFPSELPRSKLVPIFRELVELATEIAAKGDVR